MDTTLLTTVICIAASLLVLLGVVLLGRRLSWRAAAWWVGLACLPIAALLAGMVPYLIDAWNSLATWWQQRPQPLAGAELAGVALGAIGLVLLVGSRFVPYRKRTPKPKAKKGAAASGTPAGASAARTRPDYSAPASSVTPTDTTTI